MVNSLYLNIKCTEKEIELFMFFFKLLSRLIDIFSDLNQTQEDIRQLWNFSVNFYLKKTQGKDSRLQSKCILKGEFFYSGHSQKNFLNVFLAAWIIYDDSLPLYFLYLFKENRHAEKEKYQNIVLTGTVDIGIAPTLLGLK